MRTIVAILLLVCATAVPLKAQWVHDEIFVTTMVFGLAAPGIPVMVEMADLYGLAEFSMGSVFLYYALMENTDLFLYAVPMLASSVYLIRYDDKVEPWKHLLAHGGIYYLTSYLGAVMTEIDIDRRITIRPTLGGATLRVRF